MNLMVPISLFDELSETIVKSTGTLDLASGEIRDVRYEDHDLDDDGLDQHLPAADVESAIADAVTQIRARLEALPDILAPQLAAEPDEAKCRALLADEIEHALTELARAFGNVARAELN